LSSIDVLLFDLGGVLVEFSGVRDLAVLLQGRLSESEILEHMSSYLPSEQFGLGKLGREDFGNRFVKDWNLELPPEDFLREFQTWSKRLLPGAVELLTLLRPRFRLAALSNSNELHWDRNTNDLGVTGLFEVAISSHQVGLCKPDPKMYLTALDRLGASPETVMFFDDVPANVAAASALGIRAFQVEGVEGVRSRLMQEQLL
jgi:HAD superfamily hydrolase (TIGR01509 family)